MTRKSPGSYGVDAPYALLGLGVPGVVLLIGGFVWTALAGPGWNLVVLALGVTTTAQAALYLYVTRRGKFAVWAELLDELDLRGDERLLDMGCGRGMVLVQAAGRLTTGTAVGLDLWRTGDQSGNDEDTARANARAAGVADRVELRTGDMTAMPFEDGTFDLVVSSLAVHNIPDADARRKAIEEAARVLRPGGRLVIADFRHVPAYAGVLARTGWRELDVRGDLGPRFWYGGPWTGTALVTGTKPVEAVAGGAAG